MILHEWSLRDRDGLRHLPLRGNDEDAEWTPIACGGGIVLPGPQRREPVDCPECLAVIETS
jgi:hypothetical protein